MQKADKSALASKVSRVQFDATTEQLNHMMQDLVAKMSGQEQDWQKVLDKLLAEMDSKVSAGEAAGRAGLLSTQVPTPGWGHLHFPQGPDPLPHTSTPAV
jgi:formate dehydrogenase maturation protein FdhE